MCGINFSGNEEMVRKLVNSGADIELRDKNLKKASSLTVLVYGKSKYIS